MKITNDTTQDQLKDIVDETLTKEAETYYHGSPLPNIKELEPRPSRVLGGDLLLFLQLLIET
jgi:hypothetical protein